MSYLESKFIVVKNDGKETFSLIKLGSLGLVPIEEDLERKDIIKIMDDCSKWLDQEAGE